MEIKEWMTLYKVHFICIVFKRCLLLQWHHNERDCVSNLQRLDCLLKCLFRGRPKKPSKLRITGLCERKSPVTVEFPAQRASNGEKWFHLMTSSWTITKKSSYESPTNKTAHRGGGIMGFTGWYCGLYIKHASRRPCLVQINLRLQISYLANLKENGYNLIV